MNIFIAGLSYSISDSELESLFAEYGEITSAKVITDRETGRSKGYGFVEMEDETAGNKAIEELNETEVDGKTISVSVARPKSDAPRHNSYGGGSSSGGYNRGGGGSSRGNGGGYGGGGRNRY
ncbi:hypothetical protein EZS27_020538 [termite gut metagenome]|jgi:RNA recognition motif-containing protein|uniref:RRM domain-containing protein n=1 Tax=termite gut metagenome TaxID=433724 RepID=A0A5J4RAR9_9ZZZZ|nr:RNA-binding protein [Mediterranea sp.]